MSKHVTHQVVNGVQVLTVGTDAISISEDMIEQLSHELLDYTVSVPPQIVVDLHKVEFFGSSFIETLFRMWNRTKTSEDGKFALCAMRPYCHEVLKVTNLDKVWKIFPDVETATSELSSSAPTSE